jgi:hypothetical protein
LVCVALFTQAGAMSLVMSMWKVPDRETKELMVQFYQNIKAGMDRCQALRDAALKQIQIVQQRYGHINPRYWGAFVLWVSLDSMCRSFKNKLHDSIDLNIWLIILLSVFCP